MIKYLLTDGGIRDQETGACIPIAEGNRHYQEYLEWIENGNIPIMKQPSVFHELVNNEWVLNKDKKTQYEQEKLIQIKIRQLAINSLIDSGKLPRDFKDK